jgi:mevalonate kinase
MNAASAPAKVILLGEHAVVYRQPAIAVPVPKIRARAETSSIDGAPNGRVHIYAPNIDFSEWLSECAPNHHLAKITRLTLESLGIKDFPAFRLKVTSSIPIAAGMGSGAAISVAVIRAISAYFDRGLPISRQSELAFEVEKNHHGTPSGIDNTVVTYEQPVYFISGKNPLPFKPGAPLHFIIGHTGISSPTMEAVEKVRRGWQIDQIRYENIFRNIGRIVKEARQHIEEGNIEELGPLMTENQSLLARMSISSSALDHLIEAALNAGAVGAKLSGSGLGGNMIALVSPENALTVQSALNKAGAIRTIRTKVD